MDTAERRVIGGLLLLLGVSLLAVGISAGQLNLIAEMLKTAFKTITP
ncbi:MAG: hypothetical protein ACUVUF_05300 [Candidatus Bathycorpusculaceae bacterium]